MAPLLNQSAVTPEQEIVFASIRVDHQGDYRLIQLLQGSPDWTVVRQFALLHGIVPLLYTRLKNLDQEFVPTSEMDNMKALFLANAQRNLRLTRVLVRVNDLFSEHGIQFIPLKGPVLADQVYGDTSQRHFSDLDILIQEGDFHRANQALTNAGYSPNFSLNDKTESWLLRGDTEYTYSYQDDLLELQWAIAERGVYYPLEMDSFWRDLDLLELHNHQFYSLSPENLALTLLIHGGKHMWGKLIWIADLAHFIQSFPDFQWSLFLDRVTDNGFNRIACVGLRLAHEIGGVQLPKQIVLSLQGEEKVEHLAAEAIQNILNQSIGNEFTEVSYYLRSRERLRDRLFYIIDQAFVPKQEDWLTVSFPRLLYPAYYLYRPLRLAFKFVPKIIQNLL